MRPADRIPAPGVPARPVPGIAALLALLPLLAGHGRADDNAARLPGFRVSAVAVQNAKLVIEPGQVVEQGRLVIRDGVIESAAADAAIPIDAEVIDATGLVAYAGFIDAATEAFLDVSKMPAPEPGRTTNFSRDAFAATPPDNRRGMTPELLASDFLEMGENAAAARRGAGMTAIHVLPLRPVAGGQSCLAALSGLPEREALLADQLFCVFHIEPPPLTGGSSTAMYPITLMGATAHLRQAFLDARFAQEQWAAFRAGRPGVPRPARDAALDTLAAVASGERRGIFVADSIDSIRRALDFAREIEAPAVIVGGRDAWRCADRLKELDVPVILRLDFGKPPEVKPAQPRDKFTADFTDPVRVQQDALDRWQQHVASASRLHAAGVRFAFSSQGLTKPADWLAQVRLLVKHGLPADVALAAMTRDAAALLGQESRLGSLRPGHLGHVVLLTGPWEDERSKVRYVIVDGRPFEFNKDAKPLSAEPTAVEPAQLAGRWNVRIESGEMQTTVGVLELAQSGGKLTGAFTSEQGSGKLTSGTVTGADVEFRIAIGAGASEISLQFRAKHEPKTIGEGEAAATEEALSGTVQSPFGAPAPWTAKKEAPAAPADNPVRITVEGEPGEPAASPAAAAELPTELDSDRRGHAAPTHGRLLLQNGVVLTGAGETLVAADVLVRDGKIAAIGVDLTAEEGVTAIDLGGWYVMPGMVDTHSHIMIEGGVNESSQSVVPEVRIKDVVRSEDVATYRALAGGLTTVRLLHGSANCIGGQDAVVKLKYGAPASEMILWNAPQGVKFALGENVKSRGDRFPNTRMGVEATLKRAFYEALDYRRQWQAYERARETAAGQAAAPLAPRRDLRLEALAAIIDHDILIHCHCYRADEILMLLRTAESLGIHVQSLQHVLEGFKIAPEIRAHGASCSTFSDWWAYKMEAYDATPYSVALLQQAGINIVVKSDDSERMRHLNQEAAKSLRYGNMPADDALHLVTLNAARELGLDERIGSIEVGKDADLAVFNGHPFSPFSRCELTIIEGEVRFQREGQPTAMSHAGQERSKSPPAFELAPTVVRERTLEFPPSPSGVYALTGAAVHPVDADDLPSGVVLIAGGRITAVGAEVAVPENATVIDVTGMHVYPGLIDGGTSLGIAEIKQVDVTRDAGETGRFQPDVRAGIAVNVDSELIPVARAGGITTAFVRPDGPLIGGQYSLLQTAGWTSEEMVIAYEAGLALNWPNEDKDIEELRAFFKQARLYDKIRSQPEDRQQGVIQDPRFEAMRPYVAGTKRVFIEADTRKAIAQALLFAEEEQLRIVITGGKDAWKLAGELKARDVPVIVGPTMDTPTESWDPCDAPYANPGLLYEAGVEFCIRSNNASNSRNAPFEAAIAVGYGLPAEEALKAVTLNAARVLGIDEQVGSITAGKTANLIITDGSPLHQTTQIKGIFVAGRPFLPESKQTRLYQRYLQRLTTSSAN